MTRRRRRYCCCRLWGDVGEAVDAAVDPRLRCCTVEAAADDDAAADGADDDDDCGDGYAAAVVADDVLAMTMTSFSLLTAYRLRATVCVLYEHVPGTLLLLLLDRCVFTRDTHQSTCTCARTSQTDRADSSVQHTSNESARVRTFDVLITLFDNHVCV